MTFSVIVPIYKVEKYLEKCIQSIVNQDYTDFELILVNDGSPDACPKICRAYAEKDSRIHVVNKENGGLVSARNAGLMVAKGDYILYVDGDDWIVQGTLKTIWNRAITNKNPDMIVFNMTRIFNNREEKDPCYVSEGLYEGDRLRNEIYPYMMYDSRKPFYHGLLFPSCGGKVVNRKILLQHYCKNENIRMGEDNAFIFECMLFSKAVYFLTEHFYIYNQLNEESIRHCYDPMRLDNNKLLTDYITKHLYGINITVDKQINVFKAYWLIMAIFHEVKNRRPVLGAAKHIKEGIRKYRILEDIDISKLPMEAKIYMKLLQMELYMGAIWVASAIELLRGFKKYGSKN